MSPFLHPRKTSLRLGTHPRHQPAPQASFWVSLVVPSPTRACCSLIFSTFIWSLCCCFAPLPVLGMSRPHRAPLYRRATLWPHHGLIYFFPNWSPVSHTSLRLPQSQHALALLSLPPSLPRFAGDHTQDTAHPPVSPEQVGNTAAPVWLSVLARLSLTLISPGGSARGQRMWGDWLARRLARRPVRSSPGTREGQGRAQCWAAAVCFHVHSWPQSVSLLSRARSHTHLTRVNRAPPSLKPTG